jgi:succinate dehydrogenase / fumarate reductase membrane anchor subunit
MVIRISGITGRGVTDFVLQRVTAVVLTLYTAVVIGFFALNQVDYQTFETFFGSSAMKVASSVAILATIGHAWVGMWTIGTDYIQPGHWGLPDSADKIRVAYQVGCIGIMATYFLYALKAIW